MTTLLERERGLLEYASNTVLTASEPKKFYFGYTWVNEEKGVLTKEFMRNSLRSYKKKIGKSATEVLIKTCDIKEWMEDLGIQIVRGPIPTMCFYLGVFYENNTADSSQSQETN